MFLKSLRLRNFRNYTDALIHFGPRVNVIAGENAQGKTNLLEAIHLLSCGRSFRTNQLDELIQKGKTAFYLEAAIVKHGVPETLRLHYDGKMRKFQYNATLHLSFNSLLGIMPSVLHAPSDLDLIGSAPQLRRRFLNLHLAQHDPIYVHHLLRYFKAMKQRNALLKNRKTETIECWEEEMAVSASYLTLERKKMLKELQAPLFSFAKELLLAEELQMEFLPSFPFDENKTDLKQEYLFQFQKNRPKEMAYGKTIVGPHREDFQILLNHLPARSFASEGQKEACSFALRLAEWERLSQHTDVPVLMSIDDFGAHLDERRLELFQKSLHRFLQLFITTPRSLQHLPESKRFVIEQGQLFNEGVLHNSLL